MDDKVCVVGIFGKDNIGYKSKAVHLNGTIGKEVFKVCLDRICVHSLHVSLTSFSLRREWTKLQGLVA